MAKDLPRFYWPSLSTDKIQHMDGPEAEHAGRVLRLKVDDEIIVLDGNGRVIHAQIETINKKNLVFKKLAELPQESPESDFHLVIAPTKNMDRLEWCVEKCTEIGMRELSLVLCQNSERRRVRIDRLEKIAVSAMKQSKSSYLLRINDLRTVSELIESKSNQDQWYVAHCRDGQKESLNSGIKNATVFIGPEGDFTEEEIEKILQVGAKGVHLGDKRLRTETAAVVACTLLNI